LNAAGLALVALTRTGEVGIDVEQERPVRDALAIARRLFAPREYAWLRAQSAGEQDPAFLRCWTRKEAVVKAAGAGLRAPLDAFEVPLEAEAGDVRVLDGRDEAEASGYRLSGLSPGRGCWAALCTTGPPPVVSLYDVGHIDVRWPCAESP
jgi:4'-phosphopantetheinyl transferase